MNHVFYEGLCASEQWNAAWITYFTRVCVLLSSETQRESCILRGFVCFCVEKRSVNHILYEGLCASNWRNATWITYFTRVCVPQSSETHRELRILQGFVCFKVEKRSVNHVFYEGLCASNWRNVMWIRYFRRMCRVYVPQSSETQRASRILRGFVCFWAVKRSVNHVFYKGVCASE